MVAGGFFCLEGNHSKHLCSKLLYFRAFLAFCPLWTFVLEGGTEVFGPRGATPT